MSVYFIFCDTLDRFKIGYSAKPELRFVKMQSDSPTQLSLVSVIEGDEASEAALHERFEGDRLHGEWFNASVDLKSFVASLPPYRKPPRKAGGGKLGEWIRNNGTTQTEFAEVVGLTGATISRIACGKVNFRIRTAQAICKATNHEVTLQDLIDALEAA